MGKVRLSLEVATGLARGLVAELAPGCERIAVAGSVRRREAFVGDIEIVAIPTSYVNLIGQPDGSLLDPILERLIREGRLLRGRCSGNRYKQFGVGKVDGLCLDLFLVRPESWGVQLAIRTGPAEYSRMVVTQRRFGGLLDDGLYVADGCVWEPADDVARYTLDRHRGQWQIRPTPEEADFFKRCGGRREPWNRGTVNRRTRHGESGRACTDPVEAAHSNAGQPPAGAAGQCRH